MMMRLCFGFFRSLLIVVNLLVIALAALLVYVSFNAFDQSCEIDPLSPGFNASYMSMSFAGLGLIIALLAFTGFLGALQKSKTLLVTYAALIFLVVSLMIVLYIITFTSPAQPNSSSSANLDEVDRDLVNSTVVMYNHVDSSDMKTKFIDYIQRSYSCCGVNSPADWLEYSLHKIPRSCCMEPIESSLPVFKYCAESDYKIGCRRALIDHFRSDSSPVRAVFFVLMSLGITCTTAAGFLIGTLRRHLDIV